MKNTYRATSAWAWFFCKFSHEFLCDHLRKQIRIVGLHRRTAFPSTTYICADMYASYGWRCEIVSLLACLSFICVCIYATSFIHTHTHRSCAHILLCVCVQQDYLLTRGYIHTCIWIKICTYMHAHTHTPTNTYLTAPAWPPCPAPDRLGCCRAGNKRVAASSWRNIQRNGGSRARQAHAHVSSWLLSLLIGMQLF